MSRQGWVQAVPPYGIADGTAVTGAATLTDAAPAPSLYLPPNILGEYPGARLSFEAWGVYTTNATAATITFGWYSGTFGTAIGSGVAWCVSSAVTLVASSTNRQWRIEGSASIRTIGGSGTGVAIAEGTNLTSGGTDLAMTTAGSTFAIDTTQARYVTLGVNISTAQSFTCRYLAVELIN